MARLQAFLRSFGDEAATVEAVKSKVRLEPMHLHVKGKVLQHEGRTDHLVLFKYDQCKTKFGNKEFGDICREARGIILRHGTWDIVCYPFDKFFNADESHADVLDWSASQVQEKLDGSIMKVWYNTVLEQWVVSTNGMIDAREACREATFGKTQKTFYDMFCEAASASGLKHDRLEKSRTYCFELLHPENTVVIQHPQPRLVHIGTRDISTFAELIDDDIGVEKPALFSLCDAEACKRAAAALPYNCEGYVVVDRSLDAGRVRRVKVKSPKYVEAHYMGLGRGADRMKLAEAAALIVIAGEESEVAAYKDANKSLADEVTSLRARYDERLKSMERTWEEVAMSAPVDPGASKKHFAMSLKSRGVKPFFFMQREKQLREGGGLASLDDLVRARVEKRCKPVKDFLEFVNAPYSTAAGGGA